VLRCLACVCICFTPCCSMCVFLRRFSCSLKIPTIEQDAFKRKYEISQGHWSLEWCHPSPMPFHTYEELPIIKVRFHILVSFFLNFCFRKSEIVNERCFFAFLIRRALWQVLSCDNHSYHARQQRKREKHSPEPCLFLELC
jgi:hypothetical protein